jgi:FHA domain-containing protein
MKNILDRALHHARQLDTVVDGFVSGRLRGDRPLTPAEILTGVTRKIEAAVTLGPDGPAFPYNRVLITLAAETPERRTELHATLPPDDVRERLVQHLQRRAQVPADLRVDVRLASQIDNPAGFDVALRHVAARLPTEHSVTPRSARLVSTDGALRFTLGEGTIHVGRVADVHDRAGRLVRRNQIALESNADSRTVSRAHARIQGVRDRDALAFMLFDEGSRYGSSVVRDGRAHKVLHGNVGFKLKDGDEVYFGRVHLQFRVAAARD